MQSMNRLLELDGNRKGPGENPHKQEHAKLLANSNLICACKHKEEPRECLQCTGINDSLEIVIVILILKRTDGL